MKSTAGYLVLALVVSGALLVIIQFAHPDVRQRSFIFPGGSQMAYSPAYDALEPNDLLPDGATRQPPVPGTVAMDEYPFPFGPSRDGFSDGDTEMRLAGRYVQMPVELRAPTTDAISGDGGDAAVAHDKQIVANGRKLFGIYCSSCHGPNGEGDGKLASYVEFSSAAFSMATRAMELNDGELFYLITRGGRGGVMASYAVQLTANERWRIVRFLRSLSAATD